MDDGQESDISMPATVVISDQTMQTQPTVIEMKLNSGIQRPDSEIRVKHFSWEIQRFISC